MPPSNKVLAICWLSGSRVDLIHVHYQQEGQKQKQERSIILYYKTIGHYSSNPNNCSHIIRTTAVAKGLAPAKHVFPPCLLRLMIIIHIITCLLMRPCTSCGRGARLCLQLERLSTANTTGASTDLFIQDMREASLFGVPAEPAQLRLGC